MAGKTSIRTILSCGGVLTLGALVVASLPTVNAQGADRGKAVFRSHCAVCHGSDGKGNGPAAKGLDPKPADLTSERTQTKSGAKIRGIVRNGVPGTAMTAWKGVLSEQQIEEVVDYIRTLSSRAAVLPGRTCPQASCPT